jgi:hypothetical protein
MEDPHLITYKPARFAFKVLLHVALLSVISTMPAGKYSIKRLTMVFFPVISEGYPEWITGYHKIFIWKQLWQFWCHESPQGWPSHE